MKKIQQLLPSPTVQMIIATIAGIIFGLFLGDYAANIKFIGDIFIRLIQMSIVILVMTSVISSLGDLANRREDNKFGLKMGASTFQWIIFFTVIAASLGAILASIVRPGDNMQATTGVNEADVSYMGFQETLRNFVPTNIIESMAEADMIPVIVFSVLFGVGLNIFLKKNKSTLAFDLIKEVNEVVLNVIQIIMKIAPIGVFCLLADVVGATGPQVMISMLQYLGLLLAGTVILLLFMALFVATRCKLNPMLMPKKFLEMSIVALTTTSSAVSFPIALRDCVKKFGVDRDVANFTMSIGMTMGSAGAAMNYVVMIFFMQQSAEVELSALNIIIGMSLSILLTLGTITVPGSAAIVATFLATSLGLPLESISLLVGVDWFAGMFRTIVNVNNDVFVSLMVANRLDSIDRDVYNKV
ncbi:dicarboxylate/amino acid:cation symporter [Tetragenococcus halophilus subsp. flandriensis]|uniref:dicarboxylate/amino acid:cation symporter n=1 Tax=Tetragenococcus halophilus TaxID=51669 RepID=UPI0023EA0D8B|nr:dicarboxylate/amino acid:cation symporter [Tetragenococcus halophilus]GMA09389.1 dicarboxylate/amino acid:cation symporter [Tetragenococcus halophilus subsp. flandriensis]